MRSQTLYRHYDAEDNLLYVGISVNALSRLQQHYQNSSWCTKIAKVTMETCNTRAEVIKLERRAIAEENPKYNKHRPDPTKDSKPVRNHPYHLCISPREGGGYEAIWVDDNDEEAKP